MAESIWKSTLEEFRAKLAGRDPVPAGVSLAAISASLGLSLLMKALEITRKRKDFDGDAAKVERLLEMARAESDKLARLADEDTAAYAEYMAKRGSTEEAAALRKAIDVPLDAARSAAAGLKICADAASMIPASIAPDTVTAELLLGAAIRGMLLSVESNALRLADGDFEAEVASESQILMELAKKHQRW